MVAQLGRDELVHDGGGELPVANVFNAPVYCRLPSQECGLSGVGLQVRDQIPNVPHLRALFRSEWDIELLGDHFAECHYIHRGKTKVKKALARIQHFTYWLSVYFQVFVRELSQALFN